MDKMNSTVTLKMPLLPIDHGLGSPLGILLEHRLQVQSETIQMPVCGLLLAAMLVW